MNREQKNDVALETSDCKIKFTRNDSSKSYSRKALSQELSTTLLCRVSAFPLFVNRVLQRAQHPPSMQRNESPKDTDWREHRLHRDLPYLSPPFSYVEVYCLRTGYRLLVRCLGFIIRFAVKTSLSFLAGICHIQLRSCSALAPPRFVLCRHSCRRGFQTEKAFSRNRWSLTSLPEPINVGPHQASARLWAGTEQSH